MEVSNLMQGISQTLSNSTPWPQGNLFTWTILFVCPGPSQKIPQESRTAGGVQGLEEILSLSLSLSLAYTP